MRSIHKKGETYSMKPVSVKKRLATTSWRLSGPLPTESARGVLPLGFNSSLEAVKICTLDQLARLQDIVVHAVEAQQGKTRKRLVRDDQVQVSLKAPKPKFSDPGQMS